MVTPLDRPLRRAVTINGQPYVATMSQEGILLVRKGYRKGQRVSWDHLLSGAVTLSAQLAGSIGTDGGGEANKSTALDTGQAGGDEV
jgi:hypothetical protein